MLWLFISQFYFEIIKKNSVVVTESWAALFAQSIAAFNTRPRIYDMLLDTNASTLATKWNISYLKHSDSSEICKWSVVMYKNKTSIIKWTCCKTLICPNNSEASVCVNYLWARVICLCERRRHALKSVATTQFCNLAKPKTVDTKSYTFFL